MKILNLILLVMYLILSNGYVFGQDTAKAKKDVHTIYDEGFWMVGDDDKLECKYV